MLDKFGVIDFATTIAPGLRDVLLTGKVYEAVERNSRNKNARQYDAVVLDAPPTGRIAQFLNVNGEFGDLARRYQQSTFAGHFVEAAVHAHTGEIRVRRMLAVCAAGRILNPKTAGSQILGGVVWGIGMALHEETLIDHRFGRIVNANIAEYHVPVNADIGEVDVAFVDGNDTAFNPLGARGVGEIGITGAGGAIANAIFHATGRRIRDLPITLDKLI